MATFGFRPYPGPIADRIVYLPEAATQTFKEGDLVIISSGKVAVATDDLDVWGIAMRAATGTTDTSLPIYTIQPGDKLIAQATDATALTNKGVAYAVVMTAGSMGVNTGSTTTPGFMVEALDPRDGVQAAAGGRVIGRFLYDALDSSGG